MGASTFKVQIELNNSKGLLKPNGIASLEIQDYVNNKALIVPSQIVKKDMRGDYLFLNKKVVQEKVHHLLIALVDVHRTHTTGRHIKF